MDVYLAILIKIPCGLSHAGHAVNFAKIVIRRRDALHADFIFIRAYAFIVT